MPEGRVLAVFAHPDDESILAGGTLAACAAAGLEVTIISLTHGELGVIARPRLATRETLGAVRAAELQRAAGELGARTECLAYEDGSLPWPDPDALAADLLARIRRLRPDVVVSFAPDGLYWHPDHVAVHELVDAALEALAAEGLLPSAYWATVPEGRTGELVAAVAARGLGSDLWQLDPDAFGAPPEDIDLVLDVRAFVPAKLRAIRSHRTQLGLDHVLLTVPDDLALDFLGEEYFVRARSGRGGDPLASVAPARDLAETAR